MKTQATVVEPGDVGMVLALEADDEEQLTCFSGALGVFLEGWSERIDSVDVDLILAFGLLEHAAECAGAYGLGLDEFCNLASSCLHLGRERVRQLHCDLQDGTWSSL